MSRLLRIAIDGPGGAGKSTIAKIVAKRLGIEYIDTGAMYRAVALKLYRELGDELNDSEGLSEGDALYDRVSEIVDGTVIDLKDGRIILDDEDVSGKIRTQEVSMMASVTSKLPVVRSKLVSMQKDIASRTSVVMDGRDIGTNVIKDAEVKIFLTADPMVRARRRYDQLIEAGKEADLQQIYDETRERDHQDMTRKLNPLKKADDAIELDTSNMTIEEVADFVIDRAEEVR